jgi:polyhydroxyalkanoate synthesis regulator phasin
MFKMLEKLMYAGVGAVAITEEKAREIVNELEKKGHVTSEEGSKLVKDLVEKGKKASEDIEKLVSAEVKRISEKMQFVKKSDFDALAKEVHDLAAKIDILLGQHKQ